MKFIRLLCMIGLIGGWGSPLFGAEKLRWDRTEAVVEMKPGEETAEAVYTVTNEGDETIRIARVKTSCGCTGTVLDRKIVEPGQSTEIKASFNKGKRKGVNTNRIEVYLDDRPDAIVTLRMTVKIPELIKAQPAVLYWNRDSQKNSRPVTLTLDERYIERISDIEYDANALTIDRSLDDSGRTVLTVEPVSFDRASRQTIQVQGSGEDGLSASADIYVFVQP